MTAWGQPPIACPERKSKGLSGRAKLDKPFDLELQTKAGPAAQRTAEGGCPHVCETLLR